MPDALDGAKVIGFVANGNSNSPQLQTNYFDIIRARSILRAYESKIEIN